LNIVEKMMKTRDKLATHVVERKWRDVRVQKKNGRLLFDEDEKKNTIKLCTFEHRCD
jgi:hypothetical protein